MDVAVVVVVIVVGVVGSLIYLLACVANLDFSMDLIWPERTLLRSRHINCVRFAQKKKWPSILFEAI